MIELEQALRAEPAPVPPAVRAGIARRAEDEGLVDVAYAAADTPLGRLLVAATPRGLVRVAFPEQGEERMLTDLAARVSPRVLELPARLDPVRRQLDEYFDGRRRGFALPLDWTLVRGFGRDVLAVTAAIPFGEVRTYRQVATDAGRPRAVRAAGNALASNPIPVVVPCHRVLRTGGGLGGYAGRLERKRLLLELEGGQARLD
jgi:methylated-DNA-[protein]-cysteine S-methyltransferase